MLAIAAGAQNHTKKPIRFIFESIHDHVGNLEVNSKRVKLFSPDSKLLYEADLYAGKELDEQFFYFDKSGKLLRDHRIFHQAHESGDFRMTYDAKGNLVEEANYNDKEQVIERVTMTYNDKAQMITRKVELLHASEGKMVVESSFDFTYDAAGKIATKKGFEDEKTDQIVTFKYVHEGTTETITKFNAANEVMEKWVTVKDDKGRLIKDVHTLNEKGKAPVTKTIEFTYDQYDHILTENLSSSASTIKQQIIFEYTYDAFGNWTERKEKKMVGVKQSEGVHLKRAIEYYESNTYPHPPMELDENYNWEQHDGHAHKIFEENHVRINNNAGQLEWVVRRNGQSLFQVDEYEYKDGKLERINHLNHSEGENAYTLIKYNEKGQKIEEASYSATGVVDEKTMFEYDGKGHLIKLTDQSVEMPNGPLVTSIVEEYTNDASGRVVKTNLTEFGLKYVITYEYNEAGNITKEIQTPDAKDEQVITTTYKYDGAKLLEKLEFEGKSTVAKSKSTYEYDSRGELLRSAHFSNDVLKSESDYVYFE
jgi:YD repeat-containing protein